MSQFLTSGGQSIGGSALASLLPMDIQDWFPLGWTGWISFLSKGLSRVFSNTTVQNHQFFSSQLSLQSNSYIHTWLLYSPTRTPIHTWKTIVLTRRTLVSKVKSQLFNMPSRYYFLLFFVFFSSKEQASLNFMSALTICSDFGAQKYKVSHCFHCFPIYLPWSDGTRCHDLSFLNVKF